MKIPGVICVFCACAAWGHAENEGVKIEPAYLRLNLEESGEGGSAVPKGISAGLYLTVPDGSELEADSSACFTRKNKERGAECKLAAVDSNGKNFGAAKSFEMKSGLSSKEIKGLVYEISFDQLPSRGSKWVELSGEVPVLLRSGKKKSEPVVSEIKPGAEFDCGIYKVTVKNIKKSSCWTYVADNRLKVETHDVAFHIEPLQDNPELIEMNFCDAEGKPLSGLGDSNLKSGYEGDTYSRTKENGKVSYDWVYKFIDEPGKLSVSMTYWSTSATIKIPVAAKLPMGE